LSADVLVAEVAGTDKKVLPPVERGCILARCSGCEIRVQDYTDDSIAVIAKPIKSAVAIT